MRLSPFARKIYFFMLETREIACRDVNKTTRRYKTTRDVKMISRQFQNLLS